jgi:hypothetical protein
MKLQKLGGYAAIASVCFTFIYYIIRGPGVDMMDAAKRMAAFSAAPNHFVVLLLSFSIETLLLLVAFLAFHERMQADAVHLTRMMLIAASFCTAGAITASIGFLIGGGLIIVPTQDISAFRALYAVVLSLGYMSNHTYGWACLLAGCAILRTHSFPRILGWLFIFNGIVWIPTNIVPQLLRISQLPFIAGLLYVVTTVWMGIALLRQKQPIPAAKELEASR